MAKGKENKIVVFANQKGGVGKTTLCTMFANFLAGKGESVLVLDADMQQSISKRREMDIDNELSPTYSVQILKIEDVDEVSMAMEEAKKLKGYVLIDVPGNLNEKGLVRIFANCDVVVCPYQYELSSINSTATFIKVLHIMKGQISQMKAQIIFVPNRIDRRVGTASELDLWQRTDEGLKAFGKVAPRILDKIDITRHNTIDLPTEQKKIVSDCFEYIYSNI